jgi:hypothetical protein
MRPTIGSYRAQPSHSSVAHSLHGEHKIHLIIIVPLSVGPTRRRWRQDDAGERTPSDTPIAGLGSGIIGFNVPAAYFREQYGVRPMACAHPLSSR